MRTILTIIFLVASVTSLIAGCTIVPIDEEGNPIGVGETFNADKYVEGIWESRVIPTFREESLPIEEIIQALDKDPQEARQKYGKQRAVGGPFTFMVRGIGQVVDTTPSGLLVDLPPYDGVPDLMLKTGPVFTGTEVRDALDFIKFKDFRDVTQYFAVANKLNERVRNLVVSEIDKSTIIGKTVEFYGAFSLKESNEIILIPVILEIR